MDATSPHISDDWGPWTLMSPAGNPLLCGISVKDAQWEVDHRPIPVWATTGYGWVQHQPDFRADVYDPHDVRPSWERSACCADDGRLA